MSALGVTAVAAVAVLLAGAIVAVAVGSALRSDGEPDTPAVDPPAFVRMILVNFGPFGVVMAVAMGVAATVGDLSLATVGLGPDAVTLRASALGAALGLVLYPAHYVLIRLLRALGLGFTEMFGEMTPDDLGGLAYYGAGYLVTTSTEEAVYRAGLVGAGSAALGVGPWTAVVPAAVVFGLAHTGRGAGSVVSTAAMGVAWGAVFVELGFLAAALGHAVNNTTAAAVAVLREEYRGSEPAAEPTG